MKRIWFGAAIALIIAGLGTVGCALLLSGFDLKKFSGEPFEAKTHGVEGTFSEISIDASTFDIEFRRSEDGSCRIVTRENETYSLNAAVEGNTLKITSHEKKKWNWFFTLNFESPKMTLYLPETEYEKLTVKVSTGDIKISDIEAKTVLIHTSTGDVQLDSVIASEMLSIETSTGDVRLDGCDSPVVKIKTSTGDVNGTLLTPKTFRTETSTGTVRVPSGSYPETCEIKTSTGDIKMTVK